MPPKKLCKVVLITSTKCPHCHQFRPEWVRFLTMLEPFTRLFDPTPTSLLEGRDQDESDDDDSSLIRHIIFNPLARDANEKRNFILGNYAVQGRDEYPLLLFYVEANGRMCRWKPYWFDHPNMRTADALMLSVLSFLPQVQNSPGGKLGHALTEYYTRSLPTAPAAASLSSSSSSLLSPVTAATTKSRPDYKRIIQLEETAKR